MARHYVEGESPCKATLSGHSMKLWRNVQAPMEIPGCPSRQASGIEWSRPKAEAVYAAFSRAGEWGFPCPLDLR